MIRPLVCCSLCCPRLLLRSQDHLNAHQQPRGGRDGNDTGVVLWS